MKVMDRYNELSREDAERFSERRKRKARRGALAGVEWLYTRVSTTHDMTRLTRAGWEIVSESPDTFVGMRVGTAYTLKIRNS